MISAQLSFNFDAPRAIVAQHSEPAANAHPYWKAGMVTSLPLFCDVLDLGRRYTQMLPGVVESIDGDLAAVRIYAAPEYGYTIDNYPLHLALAVAVPLRDLGKHALNAGLQRVVATGLLAAGDEELAAEIRARMTIKEAA